MGKSSGYSKVRQRNCKKIVIGHDKRGDIVAMYPATGKPIWTKNVAVTYHNNALPVPPPKGSGPVWPEYLTKKASFFVHE
jgi:hypothetical protein